MPYLILSMISSMWSCVSRAIDPVDDEDISKSLDVGFSNETKVLLSFVLLSISIVGNLKYDIRCFIQSICHTVDQIYTGNIPLWRKKK